jgi:hypothetical protein
MPERPLAMSRDRLTVSLEMDDVLTRAHDISSPEVTDAARTLLAAADQLDQLNTGLRRNPVDPELGRQLVYALLPDGFYLLAELQLVSALGVERFEGAWDTDDYRALCSHILREGD